MEAIGGKNEQLAELVSASNAVFATFAKQDANFRKTLHLLPGALEKTGNELAKVKTASHVLGKTLTALEPFAKGLAPAQEATRKLSLATTPIIKNEIRPFAREILPVVNELAPSTEDIAKAFPKFTVSFGVLNEFFNELAYNPGSKKAGFLFFLDWGNHDLNSVLSTSDANGPMGRSLVYFNCEVLPLLNGVSEVNESVKLVVKLLNPPTKKECEEHGLIGGSVKASTASSHTAGAAAAHTAAWQSGTTGFGQLTQVKASPATAGGTSAAVGHGAAHSTSVRSRGSHTGAAAASARAGGSRGTTGAKD